MAVVSSHDPRLQEGNNAGVSQFPSRAVPAKLLLWPLSRFSSSSPHRSSKVSSAGGLLESAGLLGFPGFSSLLQLRINYINDCLPPLSPKCPIFKHVMI